MAPTSSEYTPRRARARRWCEHCNAVVPSEKNSGWMYGAWTYGGWACLRCERLTHPLWTIKTAESVGAALGWIVARRAVVVSVVLGLALGILVSVTTDIPFAPEGGLAFGALVGLLLSRHSR